MFNPKNLDIMRKSGLSISQLALILMTILCVSCNQVGDPTEADINDFKNLITVDFKAAWDNNDENVMAEMVLENADLNFPTSSWMKGVDAIQKAFELDYPEGRSVNFEIEDFRFLNSIALINVNAHIAGGKDNVGNIIPDYWDSGMGIIEVRLNTLKLGLF